MSGRPKLYNEERVRVCVQLPMTLVDTMRRQALETGCSQTWIINHALRQYLAAHEHEENNK